MMEILGNLVKTILIITMVGLVLNMLLPQGSYRPYLRMVVGMMLLLAVINALADFFRRGDADELLRPLLPDYSITAQSHSFYEGGEEQIKRYNGALVLEEYRGMLEQYVRKELQRRMDWELIQLDIVYENDPLDCFNECVTSGISEYEHSQLTLDTGQSSCSGYECLSSISKIIIMVEKAPIQEELLLSEDEGDGEEEIKKIDTGKERKPVTIRPVRIPPVLIGDAYSESGRYSDTHQLPGTTKVRDEETFLEQEETSILTKEEEEEIKMVVSQLLQFPEKDIEIYVI